MQYRTHNLRKPGDFQTFEIRDEFQEIVETYRKYKQGRDPSVLLIMRLGEYHALFDADAHRAAALLSKKVINRGHVDMLDIPADELAAALIVLAQAKQSYTLWGYCRPAEPGRRKL